MTKAKARRGTRDPWRSAAIRIAVNAVVVVAVTAVIEWRKKKR
jgi:hypothetical protein